jgi:uncharacterized protein HemY
VKSEESFSAALELHRKLQDVLSEANDLQKLGNVQMRREDLEKAEQPFSAALDLHRNAQDVLSEANNLASLGRCRGMSLRRQTSHFPCGSSTKAPSERTVRPR